MLKVCTILLCAISLWNCASKRSTLVQRARTAGYMPAINVIDSLAFAGTDTACIITYNGDLKLTHNGGVSWDELAGRQYGGFHAPSFVDDLNGWALAGRATGKANLLRTVDGGKTWSQVVDLDQPEEHHTRKAGASSIKFIDQSHGWLFDPFAISRTQDAGLSWEDSTNRFHGFARDFHFATSDRGWVCSGAGLLYRTTDAGETWEETSLPGEDELNGVFFIDDSRGWVLGSTASRAYLTSDGGATWSPVNVSPRELSLTCLHFINQLEGWTAGAEWSHNPDRTDTFLRGVLLHSEDGGSTWKELPCPAADGYSHLHFGDALHGWLVGERTLYRTNDGGLAWQPVLKLKRRDSSDDGSGHIGSTSDG